MWKRKLDYHISSTSGCVPEPVPDATLLDPLEETKRRIEVDQELIYVKQYGEVYTDLAKLQQYIVDKTEWIYAEKRKYPNTGGQHVIRILKDATFEAAALEICKRIKLSCFTQDYWVPQGKDYKLMYLTWF